MSEKPGATEVVCCVGDDAGELLAREDRSEEALWIDTSWYRMSAHLAFTGCSTDVNPPPRMMSRYLRRSRSRGWGRTRDRLPSQTIGRPRISCGRHSERQSPSGPSCYARHGIASGNSVTQRDGVPSDFAHGGCAIRRQPPELAVVERCTGSMQTLLDGGLGSRILLQTESRASCDSERSL